MKIDLHLCQTTDYASRLFYPLCLGEQEVIDVCSKHGFNVPGKGNNFLHHCIHVDLKSKIPKEILLRGMEVIGRIIAFVLTSIAEVVELGHGVNS